MITVIIPTLEEQANVEPALAQLAAETVPHQVIVVDGGSLDRTVQVAEEAGARVLRSPPGRGRQMNAGARETSGETLLFLHADVRLYPGALGDIAATLAEPSFVGGGFYKRYDGNSPLLGMMSWLQNRLRSGLCRRFVGTQALFVRRSVFTAMGGFREIGLFEDVEFSDRLRQRGKVAVIGRLVTASARRYRKRGTVRQIVVNVLLLSLYRLGASPEWLRRWYLIIR